MAILLGFVLIVALALFHHVSLRGLNQIALRINGRPNMVVISTFIGLLAVHTVEIILFALVYVCMVEEGQFGRIARDGPFTFDDAIYLSGISFSTLGYTNLKAEGAVRIIVMMQSLGGFMILTWSATFLYSVWQRAFRE